MNVNFEKIDQVNATLTISFVEEDYKNDVKKNWPSWDSVGH